MIGNFSRENPTNLRGNCRVTLERTNLCATQPPLRGTRCFSIIQAIALPQGEAEEPGVTGYPHGLWCPSSRLFIRQPAGPHCQAESLCGSTSLLTCHMAVLIDQLTKDCDSFEFKTILRRTDTFLI